MAVATPSFAESLKVAIATAPMNRMGTAQEIADAALFLSSSKATFIQGASLVSFLPELVRYMFNTNRLWMVAILSINPRFSSW
jgi:NAD(P)-dependent dehydrogenase (short-subunit alcohol dehydrogenase family)